MALVCHSAYALEAGIESYGIEKNGDRHVNAIEAAEILKKYSSVQVLDVRTANEYSQGQISNAVDVDYYSSSFEHQLDQLDKNTTWLIHCRTGVRSGNSLSIMQSLGFTSIIHLNGGISAWTQAGQSFKKF